MVVRTDDNICTECVWERKFGYVEEFFFLHFSEKFNATVLVNHFIIRNPYAYVECIKTVLM